jgi:tetratricopeptide (TPR) repeat protein
MGNNKDNNKETGKISIKKPQMFIKLAQENFIPPNFLEGVEGEDYKLLATMLNDILEKRVGEAIRSAEETFNKCTDRKIKFKILLLKGLAYFSDLLLDGAITAWENSLQFSDTALEKITSYNNMGLAYFRKGDLDKSIEFFEDSLELCEKNQLEGNLLTYTFNSLGEVYYRKGLVKKADEFFLKALKTTSNEDILGNFCASNGLAKIKIFWGDYKGAMELIEENLELLDRKEPIDPGNRAMTYLLLSQISRERKKRKESINALRSALWEIKWFKGIDSAEAEELKWFVYQGLGEIAFNEGNFKEARNYQEQALTTAINSHNKFAIGKSYLELAKLNAAEGRDVINYIVSSLAIAKETNCSKLIGQSYHQLGNYYRRIYPMKAVENYNLALAFYKSMGHKKGYEEVKEYIKWVGGKKRIKEEEAIRFIKAAKEILPSLVFIETKEKKKGRKPYRDRSLLLLCLLKLYLNISYRTLEDLFSKSKDLRALIETKQVPDHNTLQRAAKRFGDTYLKELLKPIYNIL